MVFKTRIFLYVYKDSTGNIYVLDRTLQHIFLLTSNQTELNIKKSSWQLIMANFNSVYEIYVDLCRSLWCGLGYPSDDSVLFSAVDFVYRFDIYHQNHSLSGYVTCVRFEGWIAWSCQVCERGIINICTLGLSGKMVEKWP